MLETEGAERKARNNQIMGRRTNKCSWPMTLWLSHADAAAGILQWKSGEPFFQTNPIDGRLMICPARLRRGDTWKISIQRTSHSLTSRIAVVEDTINPGTSTNRCYKARVFEP